MDGKRVVSQIIVQPKLEFASVSRPSAPGNEFLEKFETELANSGCEVEFLGEASGSPNHANYYPFKYHPGEGKPTFDHTLKIEPGRSEAEKEVSRRHEGAHAILWSQSAAAHASPYNMASPIILCPRDWVKFVHLSERAAMAFTSFLGFMDSSEEIKQATAKEPATAEDFAAAMSANRGQIEVALNRVARESLTRNSNHYMKPWGNRPTQEALTLYNYYIWQALKSYEDSNFFRYEYELHDGPAPVFVRLGDEDILKAGELMGLSAFGSGRPDSFFAENPQLMWKHHNWQMSLNVKLGLASGYEDSLPTVSEALENHFGMKPEEFVAYSKSFRHGDAPLALKPYHPHLVHAKDTREPTGMH